MAASVQKVPNIIPDEALDNYPINTMYMDARPTDPFYSSFPNYIPFYVQDVYKQYVFTLYHFRIHQIIYLNQLRNFLRKKHSITKKKMILL